MCYRALLSPFQPGTYLVLTQVTDTDFDLGEIICKDNVQVSRKWYNIQVQAIQCRDVGCDDKMQDNKVVKKLKGGVPDISIPEARSGMTKKCAQGDADAEHRSNKRHHGETDTQERTPVSVCGAPSERNGCTIECAVHLGQWFVTVPWPLCHCWWVHMDGFTSNL